MRYSDYEQQQMDAEFGLHLDRVAAAKRRAAGPHPVFQSILTAHGAPDPLGHTCNMCGALPGYPCSVNCPENDNT